MGVREVGMGLGETDIAYVLHIAKDVERVGGLIDDRILDARILHNLQGKTVDFLEGMSTSLDAIPVPYAVLSNDEYPPL